LQIVVGIQEDIVGAVTFIVAPGGMLIDAMGVSNGHGLHCCNLGRTTFLERHKGETELFEKSDNGGFQGFGIGGFLLNVAAYFATFVCKEDIGANITLKTSQSAFTFYEKYGFTHTEPYPALPTKLRELVPSWNTALTQESTWLVSQPVADAGFCICGIADLPELPPSPEAITDTSPRRGVVPAAKVAQAKLLKRRAAILEAFNRTGGHLEPGRSDGRDEVVGGYVAREPEPGGVEPSPGGEVDPPPAQESKTESGHKSELSTKSDKSQNADSKPPVSKKDTSKVDPPNTRTSPRKKAGDQDSDSSDSEAKKSLPENSLMGCGHLQKKTLRRRRLANVP
jgi:hypothetical protein